MSPVHTTASGLSSPFRASRADCKTWNRVSQLYSPTMLAGMWMATLGSLSGVGAEERRVAVRLRGRPVCALLPEGRLAVLSRQGGLGPRERGTESRSAGGGGGGGRRSGSRKWDRKRHEGTGPRVGVGGRAGEGVGRRGTGTRGQEQLGWKGRGRAGGGVWSKEGAEDRERRALTCAAATGFVALRLTAGRILQVDVEVGEVEDPEGGWRCGRDGR